MNRRRISIVGPTASGKTALSISLAELLGVSSILSCDSMAIYRHMDIGTAKPTAEELGDLTCHMIDVVDPCEEFSIAQFVTMVAGIEETIPTSSPVIFVGGSGLYHTSVFDHLSPPPTDPVKRAELTTLLELNGLDWGYLRLTELDPAAVVKIEPQNFRRIVRALEVIELTGRPFSSFGPGVDAYPIDSGEIVGLFPGRDLLEERIRSRNNVLFEKGWIEECRYLLDNFALSATAAKAIGYSEIFDFISGKISLEDAKESVVARSKKYAKRQMAWFRRDPRVKWFNGVDDALVYLKSKVS
ncbi:MAG: tRNA (adenosine(37)-N6)-dimethylallyltransferase MiaA [Actinomycetota bacterium]|nr:tRNA (adenosine(37)-N6)-dimethylallyltransferase MiaA [Actinomycetota bacterium]